MSYPTRTKKKTDDEKSWQGWFPPGLLGLVLRLLHATYAKYNRIFSHINAFAFFLFPRIMIGYRRGAADVWHAGNDANIVVPFRIQGGKFRRRWVASIMVPDDKRNEKKNSTFA